MPMTESIESQKKRLLDYLENRLRGRASTTFCGTGILRRLGINTWVGLRVFKELEAKGRMRKDKNRRIFYRELQEKAPDSEIYKFTTALRLLEKQKKAKK